MLLFFSSCIQAIECPRDKGHIVTILSRLPLLLRYCTILASTFFHELCWGDVCTFPLPNQQKLQFVVGFAMATNSTRSGFVADCDSASWFPRSSEKGRLCHYSWQLLHELWHPPSVCGMHGMCAVTSPQPALQHDITRAALGNRRDGLGSDWKVTNSTRYSTCIKMTIES